MVVALAATACGGAAVESGDDGETGTVQTDPVDEAPPTTPPAPGTQAPADDGGGESPPGGPVNVATVTVGDMTYEADVTPGTLQRCDPDFFNAFWALGGGVELFLPPPDDPNHTDAPRVVAKDEASGLEWVADPTANQGGATSIPEGDSQVDSFTIDGNTATGTATFIEQEAFYQWTGGGDQPKPVQGTFEVTCAEE